MASRRLAPRLRESLLVAFSLGYAAVLQALPMRLFKDRENYLRYAQDSGEILRRNLEAGPLQTLFNEPAWLAINTLLAHVLGPDELVRAIIFVASFVFSLAFVRADSRNTLWLLVFLFSEPILKNFTTHLRQGLAMAVFFLGYLGRRRRPLAWWCMMMAPFIHSSFFVIALLAILPGALRRIRLGVGIRVLTMSALAVAISSLLGSIAQVLGARQAQAYDFTIASGVTGLGFVFWLGVLTLFVLQALHERSYLVRHEVAFAVATLYLVSYFLAEVAARVLESGLPLVLIAGLMLTGVRRVAFIAAFAMFMFYTWLQNVWLA